LLDIPLGEKQISRANIAAVESKTTITSSFKNESNKNLTGELHAKTHYCTILNQKFKKSEKFHSCSTKFEIGTIEKQKRVK